MPQSLWKYPIRKRIPDVLVPVADPADRAPDELRPAHKEIRARSPAGSIHLPRRQPPTEQTRPGLPAHLVLEEKVFREPGGNGALDAGETGSLHLRIGNDGLGPARVSVRLTPLGPVEYLLFERYWAVGELLPGHSRSLEIPLKAGLDVAEGHRKCAWRSSMNTAAVRFPSLCVSPPGPWIRRSSASSCAITTTGGSSRATGPTAERRPGR